MNAILNNATSYGASLVVMLVVLVGGVTLSFLSAFSKLI